MTHKISPSNITSTFVVLEDSDEAKAIAVSDRFYEDLEQKFGTFKGKRLISHHTFDKNWNGWEMHPAGDEVVCLLFGHADFILEQNGVKSSVSLNDSGDYVLVPRGIWHTARVRSPSSLLFVSLGEGTQCRSL